VFCGFLAENWREHIVEHKREKQYIFSMIKELEADTAQANAVMLDSVRIKGLDSLVNAIYGRNIKSIDSRRVYYLKRKYVAPRLVMLFGRNTISQLKNGGNMRLIRNQSVVDSLYWLDNGMTEMEAQMNAYSDLSLTTIKFGAGIFDENVFLENGVYKGPQQALIRNVSPEFLSNDYGKLVEFANYASFQAAVLNGYHHMLSGYKEYASRLITYLKKEYHLQ
ncbi:MAG TPA: hypothetical protein VKC90_01045, partial [Chitinophagaceae bacterium]|nr:hypothetical protein [Chitinophagaceae bacterium]